MLGKIPGGFAIALTLKGKNGEDDIPGIEQLIKPNAADKRKRSLTHDEKGLYLRK